MTTIMLCPDRAGFNALIPRSEKFVLDVKHSHILLYQRFKLLFIRIGYMVYPLRLQGAYFGYLHKLLPLSSMSQIIVS